jgi:hypothetical protein
VARTTETPISRTILPRQLRRGALGKRAGVAMVRNCAPIPTRPTKVNVAALSRSRGYADEARRRFG